MFSNLANNTDYVILFSKYISSFPKILTKFRSSRPEAFLGKGVLKMCSKFTGEHPCRICLSNFIEIRLGAYF